MEPQMQLTFTASDLYELLLVGWLVAYYYLPHSYTMLYGAAEQLSKIVGFTVGYNRHQVGSQVISSVGLD